MSWDYLNQTLSELAGFSVRVALFIGTLLSLAGYLWYSFREFKKKIRRRSRAVWMYTVSRATLNSLEEVRNLRPRLESAAADYDHMLQELQASFERHAALQVKAFDAEQKLAPKQ